MFLIIVIIVLCKLFVLDSLSKNRQNINVYCVFKKNIPQQSFDIINTETYNTDDVIYFNILRKQFYLYKDKQLTDVYNYSVLSSRVLLSKILNQCNDNFTCSVDVDRLVRQYPILQNLKFGQNISCIVSDQNQIKHIVWKHSNKYIHIYSKIDNDFSESIVKIVTKSDDGLCYKILFTGELNGTLIDSVRTLGLEESFILNITKALQYQLDFRKLQQGDRFAILTSVIVNSYKKLHYRLIGFRLFTAGKNYYVFQVDNGRLYNQQAVRLGNNFIRFPVDEPYRISSKFNLNRLNPVTRQISPHPGIDLAVPVGTPVLSVGDGEVTISKYSKVAGNYIEIKHHYKCITRYMHLKKNLVKKGQKVKKGEKIALSGNTGRSTGPHLHFEIWVNHQPVNPLTADILSVEQLLGNDRVQFLCQVEKIIPQLSFN